MPFYELIFETGSHSVAQYADDEEALGAVAEQHRRAKAGDVGGPSGHAAERIARVLKYDEHPADLNDTGLADPDALLADLRGRLAKLAGDQGGQVSFNQAVTLLQQMNSPIEFNRGQPHESIYVMPELTELAHTEWDGAVAS